MHRAALSRRGRAECFRPGRLPPHRPGIRIARPRSRRGSRMPSGRVTQRPLRTAPGGATVCAPIRPSATPFQYAAAAWASRFFLRWSFSSRTILLSCLGPDPALSGASCDPAPAAVSTACESACPITGCVRPVRPFRSLIHRGRRPLISGPAGQVSALPSRGLIHGICHLQFSFSPCCPLSRRLTAAISERMRSAGSDSAAGGLTTNGPNKKDDSVSDVGTYTAVLVVRFRLTPAWPGQGKNPKC